MQKIFSLAFVLLLTLSFAACTSFKPSALDYSALDLRETTQPLEYGVFTPPNWTAGERLPLVVFLHGGGGSHYSFEYFGAHSVIEQAMRDGRLPRAIVVTPNGDNGFWENWHDGTQHYRDWVLQQLMPKIQKDYTTLDCPQDCHLIGISMGGFGALRFVGFEPGLFSSVSAISAPLFTESEAKPSFWIRILLPLDRIFGNDTAQQRRDENPTKVWIDKGLYKNTRLQLVWGDADHASIVQANQKFHLKLDELHIEHDSHVYQGGHKWKYWVPEMERIFAFSLSPANKDGRAGE